MTAHHCNVLVTVQHNSVLKVLKPTTAAIFTYRIAATISSKNNTVGMMGPSRRSR